MEQRIMSDWLPLLWAQVEQVDGNDTSGLWATVGIGVAIFGVLFLFISVIVLGTYGKLWFQA
jgi:hypothetical protein